MKGKYDKICEDALDKARKETHIKYKDWIDSPWSGFFEGKDPLKVCLDMSDDNCYSTILNYRLPKLELLKTH